MKFILIGLLQSLLQAADVHTLIYEHQLYENLHQEDRTYAYYKMVVGKRYMVTGQEHLTIKVIADSYLSDPDVFISRTERYPTSSKNSEWYCEREGSETCVLHNGEYQAGDTLYIGVSCIQQCDYKLRAWFTQEIDLTESHRTQMRFDAYSTQILKYYIPFETADGAMTTSMEVIISPEDTYVNLDAHLSLDSNFYLIEEKPAAHIVSNGVAIKFTEKDYSWCRKCYVYVILNIYTENRYYITSIARRENDQLTETLPTEIMVNPFQQECFEYFVLRSKEDVKFSIVGYTGHADAYVQPRDVPLSPSSNKIILRASHGPNKAIIVKAADRQIAGYTTGTYNLCFYAYSPFSAHITSLEADFKGIYDFEDGQIITQRVSTGGFVQGRYTNSELRQKSTLKVHLDVQGNLTIPKVWYKLCGSQVLDQCVLDENQVHGGGEGMTELKDLNIDESLVTHLSGRIPHNPDLCENKEKCYYMFSVSNKNGSRDRIYSMRVELEFYDPGNIDLEKSYQNVVNHGQFIRHEISPYNNPNMVFLKTLSIKLQSLQGDADLFVSFNNPNPNADLFDLRSRRSSTLNQVVIENKGGINHFERTIFFTIYGSKRTQYRITFDYEFMPIYNQRLESATALADGEMLYTKLLDEYQEGFYSFKPWWSADERRSVVFLADVIFNKVFFYSQWNDYPKHFLTTKHDQNDTIIYYREEKDYHYKEGSYYIRLRPDYALYDLISSREYMYNMYAFSQPPRNGSLLSRGGWETLELGKNHVGYTNNSDYQDYRYFLVDMKSVLQITLQRLPNQGKPIFFVKMMDSDSIGPGGRADAYHFQSQEHPEKPYIQNLTLDNDMRRSRWAKCGSLLLSLQEDGRQLCFVGISVRCGTEEDCAYNLKIESVGVNSSIVHDSRPTENFIPTPPMPVLAQEFVSGYTTFNKSKYHYFPVSRQDYGNSLILVNKTQIFGTGANGDSRLLMNLQTDTSKDASGADYRKWIYPTDKNAGAISSTQNNTWPELIEPCEEVMVKLCQNASGCSFVVGVAGGTQDKKSSYRIKGFRGNNKLHMNEPIEKTVTKTRTGLSIYDYYWFVINDTVAEPNKFFQYQVSVSSSTGNDPDLFVSVMDGRFPVAEDYDFASTMKGADSVQITSNDTFWDLKGWNTSAGVVVVAGVRQANAGNYTIVLTSQLQQHRTVPIQRINVGQSIIVSLPKVTKSPREYDHVLQLYNWGHKDIQIQLDVQEGSAVMMYNEAGQYHRNTNIFTGIPYNANNSLTYREVNTTYDETNNIINIPGDQCFNCWYFIRIRVNDTRDTTYQLSVSENSDSGGPPLIRVGTFQQIYILQSLSAQRKFILDSMDNFILEATCVSGEVTMYVGLDPDTVGPGNYIWMQASQGGAATLSIKTTDLNFHMATYYYVKLFANDFQDTLLNLNLYQQRSVEFIPNNHDSTYSLTHASFNEQLLYEKYQYTSAQEYVKFHVFQVPGAVKDSAGKLKEVYYKAKISINSLTPHFYPMIYLKKIELAIQPTELSQMIFPTINDYFIAFGEDPLSQLYAEDFEYTFKNVSTQLYTYYTVAVYENNWGLTEQKKSEYQIKVEADVVGVCEVIDCGLTKPRVSTDEEGILQEENTKEVGSVWQWIDHTAREAEQAAAKAVQDVAAAAQEELTQIIQSAEDLELMLEEAVHLAGAEQSADEESTLFKDWKLPTFSEIIGLQQ